MAYQLVSGNSLESLISDHLAEFTGDLFGDQPWVILQSQNLGQWLKLHLADRLGSCPSPEILTIDQALRRLLEPFLQKEKQNLVFMDHLKTLVYFALDEVLKDGGDPSFLPLAAYAGGKLTATGVSGSRVFTLADHIAGTFHSYAMNSPLVTSSLETGICPDFLQDQGVQATWVWQAALWKKVFGTGPFVHAGALMRHLGDHLPPVSPGWVPPKLVLAGSVFLSRSAAAFLRVLAQAGWIEVVHLLVLPANLAPPPGPDRPPVTGRPWGTWGAYGRVFLKDWPATGFRDQGGKNPSFLADVQRTLRTGARLEGTKPDRSLRVISCPHPLRELEVLKELLLDWLEAHPGVPLNQVAVMAPDMNRYAPFLGTVFQPGVCDLDFHVVDLKMKDDSPFHGALGDLMALFTPEIDRTSAFSLFRRECFLRARGIDHAEVDLWLEFTDRASIFRQRGREPGAHTWEAALDRFWTGMALEDEAGLGLEDQGGKVFPLEAGVGWTASTGGYLQVMERLFQAAEKTKSERNFRQWIEFLADEVGFFLAEEGEQDPWNDLCARLNALVLDLGEPYLTKPLPWGAFAAFVRDQISHTFGRRGRLLTQGIHFSSLKPLRALPFRLIAVLGLNEADFPGGFQLPSFDLRRWEPGQEELSPASLDRFTFWETLSAAQEAFWIFYQGQDPQTGEVKPPSTVVSDLMDYLEDQGAGIDIEKRTIHAYEDPDLVRHGTFSPRTALQRQSLVHRRPPEGLRPLPLPPEEKTAEVGAEDLREALVTPARHHLRRIQQVSLDKEDRRADDFEDPWVLSHWDEEEFLDHFTRDFLEDKPGACRAEDFFEARRQAGLVPGGAFAELDRQRLVSRFENLGRDLQAWKGTHHPRKATPDPVLWDGKPWAPPPLWETDQGLTLVHRKKTPHLRMKDQWTLASRVLPLGLGSHPEVPAAVVLDETGTLTRYQWGTGVREFQALARVAQDYWRTVRQSPLPFYPDLVENLVALAGKEAQDWAEVFPDAWEKTLQDRSSYKETWKLAHCPYARWALVPTRKDFEAWAEVFGRFAPDFFLPLMAPWETEGVPE